MCVLFIAWQAHPRYSLIVAANRDEFRARPTAPLGPWGMEPEVYGGRDLQAGGSWLAVSAHGRFAAVTNFRQVPLHSGGRSRGALVSEFTCGTDTPTQFVRGLSTDPNEYGGANLFVADHASLWHWSNRGEVAHAMAPGVYGLSNGPLHDDWPKMRRGREALAQIITAPEPDHAALFALLADRTPAADDELPNTGVGVEFERRLSPIFIAGDDYGTRASTVLLVSHEGAVSMREKRWGPGGASEGETVAPIGASPRR
jgi:uncharacterized protein with NRDE domain